MRSEGSEITANYITDTSRMDTLEAGRILLSVLEDVTDTTGGLICANPFGNSKVDLELENEGIAE